MTESGKDDLGTWITDSAMRSNRRSPSSAMTATLEAWALKMATSLATSSSTMSGLPAAHTRIRGSDERSICFLSSMMSEEMVL
ncbi:MAG: hypothetical protein BWY99_02848 [Synergistetes bacterium ADurb.BinA166]|nr:MAG: hypothetical protein BWY99_02848 [Synergistetes bacterium ADurb.BinA166]